MRDEEISSGESDDEPDVAFAEPKEEEVKETADEKRLRLAKGYIEKLEMEEGKGENNDFIQGLKTEQTLEREEFLAQ